MADKEQPWRLSYKHADIEHVLGPSGNVRCLTSGLIGRDLMVIRVLIRIRYVARGWALSGPNDLSGRAELSRFYTLYLDKKHCSYVKDKNIGCGI